MFTKNFNTTLFITSLIFIVEGLSFIFCIPFAIYYHEKALPFLLPGLITLSFGLLFVIFCSKSIAIIKSKYQIILLVTYSWVLMIILGTLPYLSVHSISSYLNIVFETVSGFTTTGSTIIANIDSLPKSILIWRSITQWLGGISSIIMAATILQTLNFGGYKLFSIDLPKNGSSPLRVNEIIKSIVITYLVLTFTQIILLFIGGMNLFECFCYAFGTASTGNFYPNNSGLVHYSAYIQYIMSIFMLLSGISYVFYYFLIKKKTRMAFKIEEVKLIAIIILLVTILISGVLYFKSVQNIEPIFRKSFFHVVSFITTSGYSTTNYLVWPNYILFILIFLLFIGGCTNSSSGGIKMSRFLILLRNLKMNFKLLNPLSTDYKIKYNGKTLDENLNLSILTFITVFGILFMIGTMSLSVLGINFKESAFLSISALSTFGYSQNFANFPEAGKIILITLMLLGRLEIYTLILLFTPTLQKRTKR